MSGEPDARPGNEGRRIRLRNAAIWVVAMLFAAFYFFQYSTIAPNHTDEGLILEFIDAMARGDRPFFDFVDAYGLLNWVFPVAFFKAFGHQVWGIRMWMLVLKLITLGIAYQLVYRLTLSPGKETSREPARGGRFYSAVAAVFMLELVGAPWQSEQTPYAFNTVMPLVLGAWYFLLCGPFLREKNNVIVAGALTAAAIWTKLNTGMYLLAGGLFAYFFWLPVRSDVTPPTAESPSKPKIPNAGKLFHAAKILAALGYAVVFSWFVRKHFTVWFFLYLTVPIAVVTAWTLHVELKRAAENDDRVVERHLFAWSTYLFVSGGLSLLVLVGYYGSYAQLYLTEMSGILKTIDYTSPFPALGQPGYYVGLNEYYWLQLPWLMTALFVVWAFVGRKWGPRAFGEEWPLRRARVSSSYLLVTLHMFVMYARCDETHIYQGLVLAVPVLFVILAELDAFLRAARPTSQPILRLAVAGFGAAYATTIAVFPTFKAFDVHQSDWASPKLAHLRFREKFSPYVHDASPNVFDHDWDKAESDAGAYVKSICVPGEEILLLTANRLLHFDSDTLPVGGRYDFFFYLATVGLLDRPGFDALVPRRVVTSVFRQPPRVIISSLGNVPLQDVFPEFRKLRDRMYVKTGAFRHILVYELRINGKKVDAPLRGKTTYGLK